MKRSAEEQITKEDAEPNCTEASAGSAPTAEETTKTVVTAENFWRCQVEAIYQRRNPQKLASVGTLLEKYAGREALLYAKVCKTYDLDPSKFYTDPKAWEMYDTDVREDPTAQDGTASPERDEASASASGGSGVVVPKLFGNISASPEMAQESASVSGGAGVVVPSLFGVGSFDAPKEPGQAVASVSSGAGVAVPSLFGIGSFDAPKASLPPGSDSEEEDAPQPPRAPAPAPGECKTQ